MRVDLALVKEEMEIDEVKLEPQDDLQDSGIKILSACDTLKILEEGSHIITVPVRDRPESEDEREFIASLGLDRQQIFSVSSEGNPLQRKCNICNYVLESQLEISSHQVNHEMNRHFCRLGCIIWLDTLEQILEHEYRHHSQPGHVFCCRVCDYLATDADCLATHMKTHIYLYRFVCAICRRHFESHQSLNLHWKDDQFVCGQVQYMEALSSKAELVAVKTPVSTESLCDVQIKTEPLSSEEIEQMLLEGIPPNSVKFEPQDEEMLEDSIKKEFKEHSIDNGSVWPTIPIPLRNKLRLPALSSNKLHSDSKSVKWNNRPISNVMADNTRILQSGSQDSVEQRKTPIAANILKVLPSNCMVIKLPPNTKIFKMPDQAPTGLKMPGQAPAVLRESLQVSLSGMEKAASVIKIPHAISITKVNFAENSVSTPVSIIQTALPAQTHNRSCFLSDAFNKSESRPESLKIISEIRNQIRSIEKTLPLPGTVLQTSKMKKDNHLPTPLIASKDAPKPIELILSPLSFMLAKELQNKHPLYRFMWTCPECQRSFEKHSAFRTHLTTKHDLSQEKLNSLKVILMPYKILSQNSLETLVDSKLQVPEPSPVPDKVVNLPCPLNASEGVAPLIDQTSAKPNICEDVSPPMKTDEKSAGSKKSTKNKLKCTEFQCTECSKVFTTFGALRIHKSIHTGDLPHKCNYCDKRFRTPGQVRVHHRRHTGEKPFKCKVCSLDFTHRETLISHLSRHIGMKRYKCYGCDKYFVVVSGLRAHRRLRPDTCGKVKFTARAHGPRVRVIRGEVVFEHHPEHNGYLRSEDPLNILSQRDQTDSTPVEIARV
uniref:Zinc finger protein 574 n=1 Tax=Drosophila rhopaloa TaxID=1041015 RepID=A0A6P4FKE9_DRORH